MNTPYIYIMAFALLTTAYGCGHSHADHSDDGHGQEAGAPADSHHDEVALTAGQMREAGIATDTLRPSAFSSVLKVSGQVLVPQGEERTVVATSNGVLAYANGSIAPGMPVGAGSTLATVSSKELQDGDTAEKARIALDEAERAYRRAESLVADKIISAREYEQTRAAYATARAAYEGLAPRVTAGGVRVVAPMSGYVKQLLVSQGEYVSVGQPVAVVSQSRRLQLRAEVPEQDCSFLRGLKGANFRAASDGSSLHKLASMNGRLVSGGSAAGITSGYVPVVFEFDNVGNVVAGSYAEVFLLAAPRAGVLSVPLSALIESGGLHHVFVQVAPGVFRRREVTLGRTDGERVEVVGGLKSGDCVVTAGAVRLKLAMASTAIPHGHEH